MSFSKIVLFCTSVACGSISPTTASAFDLPDGISFGADFSDVQVVAQSRGWDLQQTSFNSNAWSIDEQGITFYFCDQMLTAVDKYLDGNLRTFVETVSSLRLKWGDPQTETFVLVPGSQLEAYGVQSVFEDGQGLSLTIQIYTRNNTETVWVRKSDGSVCEQN
ncbi:MAG: hypothetical protein AAGB04_29450 [Pseudomonadota bacterium]